MTAIAFDIPAEIQQITRGLERFLHSEVIARHDKHAEVLDDPRRRYGADGRYTPEVVELIREVRMAASEAGYFNLCVPPSLGGPSAYPTSDCDPLDSICYRYTGFHGYRATISAK